MMFNGFNCTDMKMNVLVGAAVVLMMMTGCIKDQRTGADLKVGERLPDFEVVMNDGTVVSDESLKGSVSVVMFFHTTCPDCQETLPVMQRIYDEFGREGVKFAVISRGESGEVIEAYWRKSGLKMPYSAQEDRSAYEKFAKTLIPRVYVNDRDGIIRYIYTDNPVPEYDDLKSALDNLTDCQQVQ